MMTVSMMTVLTTAGVAGMFLGVGGTAVFLAVYGTEVFVTVGATTISVGLPLPCGGRARRSRSRCWLG
jgi:hypothetical protein